MAVVLYVEGGSSLERLLPWALRVAATGAGPLRLVLGRRGEEGPRDLEAEDVLVDEVRALLDRELGTEGWCPASGPCAESDQEEDRPGPRPVELEVRNPIEDLRPCLGPVEGEAVSLCVAVQERFERAEEASSERRRNWFRNVPCEFFFLRPGDGERERGGGGLATAARGPHARAGLRLAESAARAGHGPLTALVVQDDLGPDSRAVGRRRLEHFIERGLGERADDVARRVLLGEHRHLGILEQAEELDSGLIVLGSTKQGALGQRLRGSVAAKVMRATSGPAVGIARAALPLAGRTHRLFSAWLQRTVPQLERDSRLALVERVQSNSHWDFDFMTLMSLSTLIAAAGLVADSAAVIIGAMLVAPLMTPIMGVGMALVQGNPRLLRLALRSVGLGFLNAFVLSLGLGLMQFDFELATPEMLERGWPGHLELFVAFVAGLAGVYASSRSSLLAALPGVAIAAALVPPIATSGLAFALGDVDLGLGASLLFLTNFVAIVLASALGLFAVGLKTEGGGSRLTRWTGGILVTAALAMAVGFGARQARGREDDGPLREALEAVTGAGQRVIDLSVDWESSPPLVELRLGGERPPSAETAEGLRRAAAESLGEPVRLRLFSLWERELGGPP